MEWARIEGDPSPMVKLSFSSAEKFVLIVFEVGATASKRLVKEAVANSAHSMPIDQERGNTKSISRSSHVSYNPCLKYDCPFRG